MRDVSRAALAGIVAGGMLAAAIANANAADSNWKNFQTNTVNYRNQATMRTNSFALTTLFREDHGDADPGKMGGRARAYWDSGTLCNASVTRYNSNPTTIFTIEFDSNCGGYVYAKGFTHTWNGNGYEYMNTYRTPNVGPL